MTRWIDEPSSGPATAGDPGRRLWIGILANWDLVVADFASEYGIDLTGPEAATRSWRWLKACLLGLFSKPGATVAYPDGQVREYPATRIANHLYPAPPLEKRQD